MNIRRLYLGLIKEKFKFLPSSIYLKYWYEARTGEKLNLKEPSTFNEKIQWLKLYYHHPLLTQCADKFAVRDFVAQKIGDKYLNELYGVFNNIDEIDFSALPNQFVMKANHACKMNLIVKDKTSLNIVKAKAKLKRWLSTNYYSLALEWSYKNIQPKIIVERYLEDSSAEELIDYKVFCFWGKPKYIQLDLNRISQHERCFYSTEWEKQSFTTLYPLYKDNFEKPKNLELMLSLSEQLSKNFPFCRVDWYNISGEIIFGEMTFYPAGGAGKFIPNEINLHFGRLLQLPEKF